MAGRSSSIMKRWKSSKPPKSSGFDPGAFSFIDKGLLGVRSQFRRSSVREASG